MQFRKKYTSLLQVTMFFCNSNVKRIAKIHKIFDTIKTIKHGLIKITNINYVEDWKSVIGSCSCNNLSFPFSSFNDNWNKMSICFKEWRSFVNFDVLNIWVLDFIELIPIVHTRITDLDISDMNVQKIRIIYNYYHSICLYLHTFFPRIPSSSHELAITDRQEVLKSNDTHRHMRLVFVNMILHLYCSECKIVLCLI